MKKLIAFLLSLGVSNILHGQSLEYIMDMVNNNPGEKPYETKYNNPHYLKSLGFNGMVPHWHINCAINYDNYKKGVIPDLYDERIWIEKKAQWIDTKLKECKKAGMNVYPFTDFIIFPLEIWNQSTPQDEYDSRVEKALNGNLDILKKKKYI